MKSVIYCLVTCFWFASPLFAVDYAVPSMTFNHPHYYNGSLSFSSSPSNIYENPASLSLLTKRLAMSVFHTTLFDSLAGQSLSTAFTTPWFVIGLSHKRLSEDGINKTTINTLTPDSEFVVNGSYGYLNSQSSLSLARLVNERLYLGASIHHYSTSIDSYSGDGIDGSIGAYLKGNRLDISAALHNISGSSVSFSTGGSETLARSLHLGMVFRLSDSLHLFPRLIHIESSYDRDRPVLASIGASYSPFSFFSFHTGLFEQFAGLDVVQRFSVGTSLTMSGVSLQYTYKTVGASDLTSSHLFSLQVDI